MSGSSTEPLRLLSATAPAFGISPGTVDGRELRAAVPVTAVDGSVRTYDLIVTAFGSTVRAREAEPHDLPAFCPIRHINGDGTFCLNWEVADSLAIHDDGTAKVWWGVLLQFLRLQRRAARMRRWPDRREWAHGAAVGHQKKAYDAAAAISSDLLEHVVAGRATTKKSRGNSAEGRAVRLLIDGRPVVRVFVDRRRPATLRKACPCRQDGRPSILRKCRDHAVRYADLVQALADIGPAEAEFWKTFQGRRCCGTMDTCPLAVSPKE